MLHYLNKLHKKRSNIENVMYVIVSMVNNL